MKRKKLQSMMSQLMRTMCEGGRRVLDDMTDLVRGRMVEVKVNFILELKEMLVLSLRRFVETSNLQNRVGKVQEFDQL